MRAEFDGRCVQYKTGEKQAHDAVGIPVWLAYQHEFLHSLAD